MVNQKVYYLEQNNDRERQQWLSLFHLYEQKRKISEVIKEMTIEEKIELHLGSLYKRYSTPSIYAADSLAFRNSLHPLDYSDDFLFAVLNGARERQAAASAAASAIVERGSALSPSSSPYVTFRANSLNKPSGQDDSRSNNSAGTTEKPTGFAPGLPTQKGHRRTGSTGSGGLAMGGSQRGSHTLNNAAFSMLSLAHTGSYTLASAEIDGVTVISAPSAGKSGSIHSSPHGSLPPSPKSLAAAAAATSSAASSATATAVSSPIPIFSSSSAAAVPLPLLLRDSSVSTVPTPSFIEVEEEYEAERLDLTEDEADAEAEDVVSDQLLVLSPKSSVRMGVGSSFSFNHATGQHQQTQSQSYSQSSIPLHSSLPSHNSIPSMSLNSTSSSTLTQSLSNPVSPLHTPSLFDPNYISSFSVQPFPASANPSSALSPTSATASTSSSLVSSLRIRNSGLIERFPVLWPQRIGKSKIREIEIDLARPRRILFYKPNDKHADLFHPDLVFLQRQFLDYKVHWSTLEVELAFDGAAVSGIASPKIRSIGPAAAVAAAVAAGATTSGSGEDGGGGGGSESGSSTPEERDATYPTRGDRFRRRFIFPSVPISLASWIFSFSFKFLQLVVVLSSFIKIVYTFYLTFDQPNKSHPTCLLY